MKLHFRIFSVLVVMMLLAGTLSASAASVSGAATFPWAPHTLKTNEIGVLNLSTAFVGKYEVPMLSYSKSGEDRIRAAFRATSAVTGNCGPNNTWYCFTPVSDSNLLPNTVSNLAPLNIIDTHFIGWVFETNTGIIRGRINEYWNDMRFVDTHPTDLLKLSKFGASAVAGAPSLQLVGGHYRMAVTVYSGGDFPSYKLIYMYYIGNFANNSCIDGGFAYQCDVLDEITASAGGSYLMGPPSLQIAGDGTVGMAYFKLGQGIKYAYPHVASPAFPSNCGPDPHAYRCISIYTGVAESFLSYNVKLALGKTSSERSIVFTYNDGFLPDTLFHAQYVGSGGNCGFDGGIIGANRWKCQDLFPMNDFLHFNHHSYSIDIDPDGYPVIALRYLADDLSPFFLYLTYPNARVGNPNPGWTFQRIDGEWQDLVDTGIEAALAINSSGMGLIGYIQEDKYNDIIPLKYALQFYTTYLPLTAK